MQAAHDPLRSRPCILAGFFTPEPDKLTGISTYTFQILEALARRKTLRIVLLTNWREAALPPSLKTAGVEIIAAWTPKWGYWLLVYPIFLTAYAVWRTGADLVFTPQHLGALFGGKARVSVLHDLYIETHPKFFPWHEKLIWHFAFRLTAARAARIICVSEATRNELLRLHPTRADKAVVIHEAAAVRFESIGKTRIQTHTPYGLMVAHVTPFKNIERLFEALDILRQDGFSPHFYWVGRDEHGIIAKSQKRHPELDNFIPLASIDPSSLAALYAGADFYVNASLTEGFCIPIIEAQSFGLPVICSNIDVLSEIGGDGVLTFDPHDSAELAMLIKKIMTDRPFRDALSMRAKANAQRFSWDKAAEQTEDVFRQCLNPTETR